MSLRLVGVAVASLVLAVPATPALARKAPPAPVVAVDPDAGLLYRQADADLQDFYRVRRRRLLWFDAQGQIDPAAKALVTLVEHAQVDGIPDGLVHPAELAAALTKAETEKTDAARGQAELLLSRTFADYSRAMRTVDPKAMIYEAPVMQPQVPSASDALWEATRAPSLVNYIQGLGWMHPLYAQLREAILSDRYTQPEQRQALVATLARVRDIPATPGKRYLLVDAAAARLWMYEDGKPVDSMKVVVGKTIHQTPLMAGYVRYAIFNPYWNVPIYLVKEHTAPAVLRQGLSYLKASGMEVLSDWGSNPTLVDPKTIDWKAVAAGTTELRVRQLPKFSNAMGKVKFEFPNQEGIYLHDTPEKNLLERDNRHLSNGCIRLEDADRLGNWLFASPMPAVGESPEQRVDLPAPVPVYVTYLTAMPGPTEVTFVSDQYNRDTLSQGQLAAASGATTAVR